MSAPRTIEPRLPYPVTRSLDATIDVETPEQVVFSYSLAGPGARMLAALIDYAICFVALLALSLLLLAGAGSALGSSVRHATTAWVIAAVVFAQFVVLWGYYVLFEGLNDGRTPGKRYMRLRVVQDGGFSVTFSVSAIRNLARVVDMQPGLFYMVGLISVVVSKSAKRIGDILAGTIVIQEQVIRKVAARRAEPVTSPEAGLGGTPQLHTLLTDDEYEVLARFLDRRVPLSPGREEALAAQLATRFRPRAGDITGADHSFLRELLIRERGARTRGVAARSDTGAAREQHALIATGSPRWTAFAAQLAVVQRSGLGQLPEEQVTDFVARYRELTTDLARLRTATRGRADESVFALSRLVAAGHNVLYRQRELRPRAVLDYLTIVAPREIRRSWRPVLLAAAFMFGPAGIAWIAVVRHPDTAPDFIPASMIERATLGVQRAQAGEGYIPDPQLMRPVMASSIVRNNVQVTFLAFAFGVTAGLGTLWLLAVNGVSIGGVLGLYQSKGILSLILAFVAPHSVLELGAICIAGGGGLLIGAAILIPGNRTRREAFVENGRRASTLIAAATLLLVFAGTIEGFISPIPWWPLWAKASVTVVTACFFAGYISLRPAAVTAPREP